MKKGKQSKRINWKARAELVESENRELRAENARLTEIARSVEVFSAAVVDNIRDELRSMVEEEVQALDIHIG